MAPRLLAVAAGAAALCGVHAEELPWGESTHTVAYGERRTTVVVHNYAAPGKSAESAVVLALHGWHQSATGTRAICQYGRVGENAQKHGFIGVCPTGNGGGGTGWGNSWNAKGCCGSAAEQDVDDLGFLKYLVTWTKERSSAQLTRTFAVGHSNGAMMSWRLMCEASDIFHGVAPVGGGYFGEPPHFKVSHSVKVPNGWVVDEQECPQPVDYPENTTSSKCWTPRSHVCRRPGEGYPLLHVHGTKDTEEPFDLVIAQWKFYSLKVLGCSGKQQVYQKGKATCHEFTSCQHRSALCVVDGLGHRMPTQSGDGFDAIDVAWYYWSGGWERVHAERGGNLSLTR